MKLYIVCYDITDQKRLARVRKVAYGYAFGGQKSAVESYLTPPQLKALVKKLSTLIDPQTDRVNIIQVHKRAILLGKARQLDFDKGTIIL